jgi:hypothetical protein
MAEPNTEATPAFENAEENDDVEYEEIDDEAAGSGGEEDNASGEDEDDDSDDDASGDSGANALQAGTPKS